jgi:predicted metal-dependent hydrolase
MAQKTFVVPGLGEVLVAKRRGSRHIRLSVMATGKVRVGIPYWTPYATGLAFAKTRQEWIKKHQQSIKPLSLKDGDPIGKSHRLQIITGVSARLTTKVASQTVAIFAPEQTNAADLQKAIVRASEKALKIEAENLLITRTADLAKKHGFTYKAINIKRLTSKWGSCTRDKTITLNYFLMQLPWDLIDYVILHELIHTKHLNHGQSFWDALEKLVPGARQKQKAVKAYRPTLLSS